MGYRHVEVHEQAQPLYGYQGDRRPESAEVIIRREFVGRAANDIGFQRGPTGEFLAIISEYDRRAHCPETWLQRLHQLYSYNVAHEEAREKCLVKESEEHLANGDIILLFAERG
jgi:hypothetical protein